METLIVVFWTICFIISLWSIEYVIGSAGLVSLFPEGLRWYNGVMAHIVVISSFAAIILNHPF